LDGTLYDLQHPVKDGDQIRFISFDEAKGKEVFWHTSAHVLAQAILRLFPNAKPTIGPPIENGFYYDFANVTITEEDFAKIEEEVRKIIDENYQVKRHLFKDKQEAIARFKSNPYKVELIEGFEEGPITGYEQGEFFDLCRGPHLNNLGKIKAFKVLKTSGAYWKGDPSREMITRVYATSFPDRKLLKDYLHFLEEAKKAGFICDVDDSNESVNKKIRNAQLLQINYMLTVGDKEMENKTISVRTRDNVVHGEIGLDHFLQALHKEMENKSLESEFAHANDHSQ